MAPPADLHLHVLSLYCTVTFFDGCVGRITSKLRGEAKPTISEQSDCASSLEFSSCFRHVCHVVELGRYSRIPLFKQCSCLLRFTWHFLLTENVFTFKRKLINYYRGDTTSVSYFCLVTRHLLFNTLVTPMFC